jgi:hypothetical protein
MVHPQVVDGGDSLQIWRAAANVLKKQLWAAEKYDGPPAWGLGVRITTPHLKKLAAYKL